MWRTGSGLWHGEPEACGAEMSEAQPYEARWDDEDEGDDAALNADFKDYEDLDSLRQFSVADGVADAVERSKSRTKSTTALRKFGLNPSVKMYSTRLLLSLSAIYTFAAANEYWVVSWFKQYGVNLPIFFALLQNCLWPLQIAGYLKARKQLESPRVITGAMYRNYLILGLLSSFITLSRMYGLTILSPIVYVICANTEIVWESLMTRVLLKKAVSWLQLVAVGLVCAAIPLSIWDPEGDSFGSDDTADSSVGVSGISSLVFGISLSLASRFASSLNSILAELFLGQEKKSKIGVIECAVANSIIPFFTIPIVLVFRPEYTVWASELTPSKATFKIKVIIIVLCISLVASKQIDRFSKYSILQASNTIFYAGIDAFMKIVAGIGALVLFHERTTVGKITGFLLTLFSVFLLYIDKRRKTLAVEKYLAQNPLLLEVNETETNAKNFSRLHGERNFA